MAVYYFGEIARQAQAILTMFREDYSSHQNLGALTDVVEFFNAAYLSRSSLEVIAKLLDLNLM